MVMKYMLFTNSSFFLYFLQSMPYSQSQTVVVENPMSFDESGKLVSIVPNFYFQPALSPLPPGGDILCPSILVSRIRCTDKILNVAGEQCGCWGHNRQKVIQ